jgi:hypothetical protein
MVPSEPTHTNLILRRIAGAMLSEPFADKLVGKARCLNTSLRAQRSNPSLRTGDRWIASSQGLLAMTRKQLCFTGYISIQTLGMITEPMIRILETPY